jgi:hypothetical protein
MLVIDLPPISYYEYPAICDTVQVLYLSYGAVLHSITYLYLHVYCATYCTCTNNSLIVAFTVHAVHQSVFTTRSTYYSSYYVLVLV